MQIVVAIGLIMLGLFQFAAVPKDSRLIRPVMFTAGAVFGSGVGMLLSALV